MSVTISKPTTKANGVSTVLRPQSFEQIMQFAQMAARSALVPKDYYGKPENIALAVQMGSEVGLPPMQALQNIACINGRPAIWGDAMLGLVKASGLMQDIQERFEGEGDTLTAVCTVHRYGNSPVTWRFSIDDAKRAGLLGKPGPWTQYRQRMLQMRARGFALRDAFPDVLKGLISAEEAQDTPEDFGRIIDVTAHEVKEEPKPSEAARTTIRGWLDSLRQDLAQADSRDAVFAIVSRQDVQAAFGKLTGAALDELSDITDEADRRYPPQPVADDTESAE